MFSDIKSLNNGVYSQPGTEGPRIRERLKEMHKGQMKFRVSGNKTNLFELTPLDTKLLNNPKWRPFSPEKWKSDKDFMHSTNYSSSRRYKDLRKSKKVLSIRPEPYVDGLEALGDIEIVRKSPANKTAMENFQTVFSRDPWQHRIKNTQSIRAQKALETILNRQPNHMEVAIKSNSEAPSRMINKDLEVKTYEYKVFTTYDNKNDPKVNNSTSSANNAKGLALMKKSPQTHMKLKTHKRYKTAFNSTSRKGVEPYESLHSSGYYVSALERLK